MRTAFYVRVSTADQNSELQIRDLELSENPPVQRAFTRAIPGLLNTSGTRAPPLGLFGYASQTPYD
jgi:hypothetical protein